MAARAVPMFRRPCRPTPHHRRPSLRHCQPPQPSTGPSRSAGRLRNPGRAPSHRQQAGSSLSTRTGFPRGCCERCDIRLAGQPSAVEPPRLLRGLSPACHVCNPDASRSRLHWPPAWLRKCRQALNLQGGGPSPEPLSCRHSYDNRPSEQTRLHDATAPDRTPLRMDASGW
jgi:hypothetical protein